MRTLLVGLLTLVSLSGTQAAQTFSGTITDDMCGADGHIVMRMGPTDAECAHLCVMSHDAAYVLLDGKTVYFLTDQARAGKLAGQTVRIVGTLNARTKTIAVDSIRAAK